MRVIVLIIAAMCAAPRLAEAQATTAAPSRSGIEAFNRALDDATRRMDNAATLALWDDDGTSLLPATKPVVGRARLSRFLNDATSGHPGARMESFALQCFDIRVSGSWASEWCTEHQVVALGGGKRFDGRGRMLFVLHRGADGHWRIHDEMWNQAEPSDSARR